MGIAHRFLERGASPTPVNIYHRDRKLVTFHFDLPAGQCGKDAFRPRPILIPQSETEALLGELVVERGGHIEWGRELVEFSQDANQVIATIRNEDGGTENISCSWLVSCEGAHSVVRKQAGLTFEGKNYPLTFALADVEADWTLSHNENHVWMHPDGSFAALPLPASPNTWRLFFEIPERHAALSNNLTLPIIKELLVIRSGIEDVNLFHPKWIAEFKINCRMVNHFRNGRVFVAGDAAHIHSPTGGQGITTGLQDATNLAWKLGCVMRGAPEALLDTYEEERLPKAREVLNETDRTTSVFFAPQVWTRSLRDFVILPLLRMKFLQKRMFGKLSQLHVSYRESTLSHDEYKAKLWQHRPRKAGDRVPDVVFRYLHSGEHISLFQLLHKVRPIILVGWASKDQLDPLLKILKQTDLDVYLIVRDSQLVVSDWERICLLDVHRDLEALYGLREDFVCLIRPDGHIGLMQHPIFPPGVRRYLNLICPPSQD